MITLPIVLLVGILLVFGSYQQARWEHRQAVKQESNLAIQYGLAVERLAELEALIQKSPHIDLERKVQERLNELGEIVFTRLKEQDDGISQFRRDIEKRLTSRPIHEATFGR